MAKKKAKTVRSQTERFASEVRKVLKKNAAASKKKPYMTAYQILEQLPKHVRDPLIKKNGLGGKGAGVHNAATKVIARAAKAVTDDIVYFSTSHTTFAIQGKNVTPSGDDCGLFRISDTKRIKSKRVKKTT